MIVKVRDVATGVEWTLTEDADPLLAEGYLDGMRMWGTYLWPDGAELSGNSKGGVSGQFQVTRGHSHVEFVICIDFED